ncbi:uncharacterized protein LOC115722117 [Cannabis sativa]|uniref:uncharacterized protein LOC115722117 n=1 Tax=Cannabis sativa TaxID=3483 RepID=UPI0029CA93B0|nr:uncharacterized protein LOC115722117 [Cannabis sativa]
MGNEMGNNSTSSFKEEDTIHTNVEDPKGLSNKTAGVDDIKGENYLVDAAEDNNFHDKANDSAPHNLERVDDVKKSSSRKVQEESEISVLTDPPKVTGGLDEIGDESSENKLNKNDFSLGSNENKLQKQASVRKEQEEIENFVFDPISILSHDQEPPKLENSNGKQHELASIQADQSVPDDNRSEEVLGSSLKSTVENGHLSEAEESDNTEASALGESEIYEGIEEVLTQSLSSTIEIGHLSKAEESNNTEESLPGESELYEGTKEVITPSLNSSVESGHLSEAKESDNIEASVPGESEESGENEEVLTYSLNSSVESGHLSETEDSNNPQASLLGDSEVSGEVGEVLTSSSKSCVENIGHLSESEEFENLKASVETESDTFIQKKKEDLLVCGDEFESKDGDKVDAGLSIVTAEETILSDKSEEGFSTEVSLGEDDSSESETISVANSPNLHQIVPKTEDKCMIVTEKIRLREKKLENGEYKYKSDYNSTESETEAIDHVNDSKINKDCPSGEAKVVENDQPVVDQESLQESEGHIVIVTEHDIIPSDSNDEEEEESSEKRIVEEREDATEQLHVTEIKTEEIPIKVEQAEAVLAPQTLLSSVQSDQNCKSIQEINQSSCGEFLTAEVSTFDPTNLIAEIIVSKQCIERPDVIAEEVKIPRSEINRETVERVSTGSMERFSTDSESDNSNLHSQMRKSPSFNIDLQNEESESDRTPLMYHDKASVQGLPSQDNVSLVDPVKLNGHDQVMTQYHPMPLPLPMVETVVKLERSDSEKSKTPFLGFLKEEEEVHIVVTSQQHSTNGSANQTVAKDLWKSSSKEETSSTSPKAKMKRRVKSSLFGNCMCCATVIN